jgi:hypothetical protein
VNSGAGFVNVTDNATYTWNQHPQPTISNLDLSMNGYLIRAVVSGTCLPPVTSSFATAMRVSTIGALRDHPTAHQPQNLLMRGV